MPDTRRYLFHGHAAAIGGQIVRIGERKQAKLVKDGFIDLPASSLTVVGGRSTAQLAGSQLTDPVASFLRFKRATAFSEGVFDDLRAEFAATKGERELGTLTATTKVRAEVVGLEVGLQDHVRMTVRRVRGGFTARSASSSGETPVRLDKDTRFDQVVFFDRNDKAYTLIVEVEPRIFATYDTYSSLTAAASEPEFVREFGHVLHVRGVGSRKARPAAPALLRTDGGAVQGTIVKPLRWKGAAFPRSSIDPARQNSIVIPGLGTLYFGEITIDRQSRTVTMIRAKLGSHVGGRLGVAGFQDNGSWG